MYALVNTFNSIRGSSIGTIISLHKSVETAVKADKKYQRAVKQSNGQNSYIPTTIVQTKIKKGHVGEGDFTPLSKEDEEYSYYLYPNT